MLIINADDWGRSVPETDVIKKCHDRGGVTSVSAMLFMEDSERAAEMAKSCGLDVGLHLNLTEPFSGKRTPPRLAENHGRIATFLSSSKYAQLLYHPLLRRSFYYVYQSQADEFVRMYGKAPSHVDGHQHMHLSANMMIDAVIPAGAKVRRNFSFGPGEKSWLNRSYRLASDWWVSRRHRVTDYFFALSQALPQGSLARIAALAETSNVELMTHPICPAEANFFLSDAHLQLTQVVKLGTYGDI